MDEIKVSINVTDFDCTPEEISKILSIKPSKTWVEGDGVDGLTQLKRKQNGWQLNSRLSCSNSLEKQIQSLIDDISCNKDKFLLLPSKCTVEIACCIYVEDGMPEISISSNLIKEISSISACIDIDIICLSGD